MESKGAREQFQEQQKKIRVDNKSVKGNKKKKSLTNTSGTEIFSLKVTIISTRANTQVDRVPQ